MSKKPHPFLRQLERGQGYVEYALLIILVAIVAIPTVSILANPADFRDGAIYNNVYVPMLCVVQGREANCERRFSSGFPSAENPGSKEFAESGSGSGGSTSDPSVLDVIRITLDGAQTNAVPIGTYAVAAVSTGGADSVTLTVTAPDSSVLINTTNTADADSEFATTPEDTFNYGNVDFTIVGSYVITAFATKDGTDSAVVTQNVDVTNPNDAANLFAGGFNLIDAAADTVVGGLVEGQELQPGLYDFEGLAAGSGVPTRVEMVLTGPVSSSVNLTAGPYLLTSETGGDYAGLNLTTGSYSITYRPFDTNDLPGTEGTINFTVANPPDPISVDAINISVDSASAVAMAGGESYASTNSLEFSVDTTGPLGSVKYELENTASG
ncbi:MAG: hypothetical protein AAFS10_12845, partial [Myxococcota bacterium]